MAYYDGSNSNDNRDGGDGDGKSRWMIVGFDSKYLVKDFKDIKVEVEEIGGLPDI